MQFVLKKSAIDPDSCVVNSYGFPFPSSPPLLIYFAFVLIKIKSNFQVLLAYNTNLIHDPGDLPWDNFPDALKSIRWGSQ